MVHGERMVRRKIHKYKFYGKEFATILCSPNFKGIIEVADNWKEVTCKRCLKILAIKD